MKFELTTKLRYCWLATLLLTLLLNLDRVAGANTGQEEGRRIVLSESEQAWVQKHPLVYWGADPQWPPFSSFDKEDRISGIDVEIVQLIAKRAGLNLQFIKTRNWSETLQKTATAQPGRRFIFRWPGIQNNSAQSIFRNQNSGKESHVNVVMNFLLGYPEMCEVTAFCAGRRLAETRQPPGGVRG